MKKNTFYTIVPLDCHGYRIDKFLQLQINKLSSVKNPGLIMVFWTQYVKKTPLIKNQLPKQILF